MEKVKVGVIGVGRGSMIGRYCKNADNAKVVAICDKWEAGLEQERGKLADDSITFYTDYDEFLKHDMDVVVLANYATEHAPFAIKAMEAGKNVVSEVLPVQTMAQAVQLIECVERTGMKYCYAENYCFMNAPREMKIKYEAGELGEFEYGEGEYLHNCEPAWHLLTRGERYHWRNRMSAFFYCTHSVGPLLHITGMRPKTVTGFECPFNERMARMGAAAGHTAVEMVTLENGAIVKSLHGVGCSKNSIWYSVYGSKGRIESAREDAEQEDVCRVYTNLAGNKETYGKEIQNYIPEFPGAEIAKKHGHGGSDYYCLHNAFDYVGGVEDADVVDLYEALDMWMCGFFGYLSVLNGGIPMEIPDLKDPAVREQYRNDNRCTDPAVAGDQLMCPYSKGEPEIPEATYERHQKRWEAEQRTIEYGMKKEGNI
jgi:predicted dehydrogenase